MRQFTITLAILVMVICNLIAQGDIFRKVKTTETTPIVITAGDTLYLSNGWVVIVPISSSVPDYTGYTVQQRLDVGQTPKQIIDSGFPLDSLYGKTYQGGLIFFVTPSGAGGVAAPYDQYYMSIYSEWGCYGTPISGAEGTAIGTGAQNTIDIETGCNTPGTAADICANLVLGGYSDWFLPSKDELNMMRVKLYQYDLGGFDNNRYWSSSQFSATSAWSQEFGVGYQSPNIYKSGTHHVRAARAF